MESCGNDLPSLDCCHQWYEASSTASFIRKKMNNTFTDITNWIYIYITLLFKYDKVTNISSWFYRRQTSTFKGIFLLVLLCSSHHPRNNRCSKFKIWAFLGDIINITFIGFEYLTPTLLFPVSVCSILRRPVRIMRHSHLKPSSKELKYVQVQNGL